MDDSLNSPDDCRKACTVLPDVLQFQAEMTGQLCKSVWSKSDLYTVPVPPADSFLRLRSFFHLTSEQNGATSYPSPTLGPADALHPAGGAKGWEAIEEACTFRGSCICGRC